MATDSVSWLDIQGLGSEDILKQLGNVFSLHPLLLEDVVNVPQHPKLLEYEQQLVIIFQMVLPNKKTGFYIEQFGFVLEKKLSLYFPIKTNRWLRNCANCICKNQGKHFKKE